MQSPASLTTWEALPRIALASTLCSTAIVEFTIPQVVRLSRASSAGGLPALRLFPHRAALMARMLPVQSLITVTQFCAVREMHGAVDLVLGETPLNLPLSYGLASVPLIAASMSCSGCARSFARLCCTLARVILRLPCGEM